MKLHHVSFIVSDLERALEFYNKVLGLECDSSRPDLGYPGVWLTLEEGQQIHLLQLPNPDAGSVRPEHGGRDRHAAFIVNDITSLVSLLEGYNLPFTMSKSGRKAMFCRDPDGNALEFIEI